MKLVIVDLDGTLFDTKNVNYMAYKEALEQFGYTLDYSYFCEYCNGRHYLDFLPAITTSNSEVLSDMHMYKKNVYKKYLKYAKMNVHLINILKSMKEEYKLALVTTASKENCNEILTEFNVLSLFDLVLTREDVEKSKPNPEGFNKAMKIFGSDISETIIFEDSEVGLEAAKRSGAFYYKTYGFN